MNEVTAKCTLQNLHAQRSNWSWQKQPENVSFVFQDSSFSIKMRIVKTIILQANYLFALFKEKESLQQTWDIQWVKQNSISTWSFQTAVGSPFIWTSEPDRGLKQNHVPSEKKDKSKSHDFSDSLRVQSETTWSTPSWCQFFHLYREGVS